jgi:dTMP kinase
MFISFEGVDGSGKTTQIDLLCSYFSSVGIDFVRTKEPGGNEQANKIRSVILSEKGFETQTQLLLVNAARFENYTKTIKPALQEGKIVISDRFFDSTIVYQGHLLDLNIDLIHTTHKMFFNDIKPDITFLLDIDPHNVVSRIEMKNMDFENAMNTNWLDDLAIIAREKAVTCYREIASKNKDRVIVINANEPKEKVFSQILSHIKAIGKK